MPSVTMVVGIEDKGLVGRENEEAAVGAEGHKRTHVVVVDLRPCVAFVLGAYEATIASHSKEIAFGICTKKVVVAVQGLPNVLCLAAQGESEQNC